MASQIKKYLRVITLIGIFLSILTFCVWADQEQDPLIRVALFDDVAQSIISVRGQYKIVDPLTGQILDQGRRLKGASIRIVKGRIQINERLYSQRHLVVSSTKDITIHYRQKDLRYRGDIHFLINEDNNFLVVNEVDAERYIQGVLFHEISHRWAMETMKAQAVAARTYAFYQKKVNELRNFDVRDDSYSQVYGGRSAERYRTNMAVDYTKGEVLMYKGEIIPAYFHACCGGHTENVNELWNQTLEPLRGVRCPYCSLSPHFLWKKNFRSQDVQESLNARGYRLDLIKDIRVIERTNSGRVKLLNIETRNGRNVPITGKEFRDVIGPNNLKSSLFDIVMQGYYFDVIGHGWGHGVGMCQWGIHFMADKHLDYKQMLQFYYPGVEIKKIYD